MRRLMPFWLSALFVNFVLRAMCFTLKFTLFPITPYEQRRAARLSLFALFFPFNNHPPIYKRFDNTIYPLDWVDAQNHRGGLDAFSLFFQQTTSGTGHRVILSTFLRLPTNTMNECEKRAQYTNSNITELYPDSS